MTLAELIEMWAAGHEPDPVHQWAAKALEALSAANDALSHDTGFFKAQALVGEVLRATDQEL